MTKQEKINENFSLTYSSREDSTNDTIMDISINFENPKNDQIIIDRLNTWLQAIGRNELAVFYTDQIVRKQ